MDLKPTELRAIFATCRAAGVSRLKLGDFEVELGDPPEKRKRRGKATEPREPREPLQGGAVSERKQFFGQGGPYGELAEQLWPGGMPGNTRDA